MKRAHLHVMLLKERVLLQLPLQTSARWVGGAGWCSIHTRLISSSYESRHVLGGACGCQAKHHKLQMYRTVCSNPHSVNKSVDIEDDDDDEEAGEID